MLSKISMDEKGLLLSTISKRGPMDETENEAQPKKGDASGKKMSAPAKDVVSGALEDKRGSDGGGRKEEKDNPKLVEAKKTRFSPMEESSAFEGVSGGGETGGEGGAGGGRVDGALAHQTESNSHVLSKKSVDEESRAVCETNLSVIQLAAQAFGTNPARVAQAERQRDLLLEYLGRPTEQQKVDALVNAAGRGDKRALLLLLGDDAHQRAKDNALAEAASRGHQWALSLLLDNGAHLENTPAGETTALMRAARSGHLSCVEFLLSRGASVNAQDRWRNTALHCAAEGENASRWPPAYETPEHEPTLSIVKALLAAGADKTIPNIRHNVAWQSATLGGHDQGHGRRAGPDGHFKPVMRLLKDGVFKGGEVATSQSVVAKAGGSVTDRKEGVASDTMYDNVKLDNSDSDSSTE